MEGNDCYKFSTIQNFVNLTGAKPIKVALDIGCNIGAVTQIMRNTFWHAQVFAFEPVPDYYWAAWGALRNDPRVRVFHGAITACHLFEDDLGTQQRPARLPLQIYQGVPDAGMGWIGGSTIAPAGTLPDDPAKYRLLDGKVPALTLDEAVTAVCALTGADEIDYAKFDCEGCENGALGCAASETLCKMRFISGEYHDIDRFYEIMRHKLYKTHFVNLSGERWGSFFAEREHGGPTILQPSRDGMLQLRPWLSGKHLDWHVFRDEFVLRHERLVHGLS
jgi:hypothetical protein